jgi:hypothetical protein
MRARRILVILSVSLIGFGVAASAGARTPHSDIKDPVQFWTRDTAPNVALFDSLDRIAWPAGKVCYDTTIVADPAWKRHYGRKPASLERQMFRVGPTIHRWQQQWVVVYGGTTSGPGIEVVLAPDGKVVSTRASLSMK